MVALGFPGDNPAALMFSLRPYQTAALAAFRAEVARGIRRSVINLPTGCGKTVLGLAVARELGQRCLWLAHRDELLTQPDRTLRALWPEAESGIVKAERNDCGARDVVFASIQTVCREHRRLQLGKFGLVVVDEAHRSSATSYRGVLDGLGCYTDVGPLVLGLTATPERTDQAALDTVFQSIAYQYQLPRAIAEGYLVPPRIVERRIALDLDRVAYRAGEWSGGALDEAMMEADIVGNISAAVREHCADRKTLLYTVSVGQAKAIAARLVADGLAAASVDGATSIDERRDILARFASGGITHLANCAVLTEGFDEPSVGAIVLARPTTSKSLYVQIVGRGLRIYPGKTECLVVDLVGVSKRHTLVQASTLFGRMLGDEREAERRESDGVGERQPSTWYADRLEAQVRGVPASRSRLVWVRPHERAWAVGLADYGTVAVEQLGDGWTVRVTGRRGGSSGEWLCETPVDLELAIGIGEDYARRCGVCNLLDKEAAWRAGMPTEKQIKALRRYGINTTPATSGEASGLIAAHLAGQDLEPASAKQLYYLRSRGVIGWGQKISKREAGRLIARSRAK